MKKLVNYKKRSFNLPPGCKDLIDVLSPPQGKADFEVGTSQEGEAKQERLPNARLAQIAPFVSRLLQAKAEFCALSITAHDFEAPITLYRLDQSHRIFLVTQRAEREQAIRLFFERLDIKPIEDYVSSYFGVPDATRHLCYPLPSAIAQVITLTTDVLRIAYGVTDEAAMDLLYSQH